MQAATNERDFPVPSHLQRGGDNAPVSDNQEAAEREEIFQILNRYYASIRIFANVDVGLTYGHSDPTAANFSADADGNPIPPISPWTRNLIT